MMREGEVFVHILPQNATPPAGGASLATEAVAKPAATPARARARRPGRLPARQRRRQARRQPIRFGRASLIALAPSPPLG